MGTYDGVLLGHVNFRSKETLAVSERASTVVKGESRHVGWATLSDEQRIPPTGFASFLFR